MSSDRYWDTKPELKLAVVAATLYLAYFFYLRSALGFDVMRSDVLHYWKLSFSWDTIYIKYWAPGYPFVVALVREVTLNALPAVAVMTLTAGTGYLVSVLTVYKLAKELGVPQAFELALLFAVFPFSGLAYSVYPVSDNVATALLLLCLLNFNRKKWWAFSLFMAFMVVMHKATWFFAAPLTMIVFFKYKEARTVIPLAAVPLLFVLIAGATHYNDLIWFIRRDATYNYGWTILPVFDGLFGNFFVGSTTSILKGMIVLILLAAAIGILVYSYRFRFWLGVSIAIAMLLLGVWVNHHAIWSLVRFGKVSLLPIAYLLSHHSDSIKLPERLATLPFNVLFLAGLLSNLLFGYYMAAFYYK